MPYVPPPPRPPSPPHVIPPSQNFHMQQQQQQQQRAQLQQRSQQMEDARKQQLLKQQQQQHFQKQQSLFRIQKQEQQRARQQQQHQQTQQRLYQEQSQRQSNQRRQQELLRTLQSSSESGSSTVVHVTPEIDVQMSGLALNDTTEVAVNGGQANPTSPLQSAQPLSPLSTPTSAYESPPPTQTNSEAVPPVSPLTTTPASQAFPSNGRTAPSLASNANTSAPSTPQDLQSSSKGNQSGLPSGEADNRVLLKDGTQIIIQQEDEILFIGPTGIQMVVNCLPLYSPPNDDMLQAGTSDMREATDGASKVAHKRPATTKSSYRKLQKKNTFRKAKSMSSIAVELELSDEERETKSDDEQLGSSYISKRKWSRFSNSYGAHYSIQVHNKRLPSDTDDDSAFTVATETPSREPGLATQMFDDNFVEQRPPLQKMQSDIFKRVDPFDQQDSNVSQSTRTMSSDLTSSYRDQVIDTKFKQATNLEGLPECAESDDAFEKPEESESVVRRKPSPKDRRRINSTGSLPEFEDRSDSEEPNSGLEVNYYSTTLPRLKRSSGSVSFPQKIDLNAGTLKRATMREQTTVPVDQDLKDEKSLNVVQQTEAGPLSDRTESSPTSPPNHLPLSTTKEEGASSPLQSTDSTSPLQPTTPSSPLTVSLLPQPPTTLDTHYLERSGWLNKLSHRKGMFGDKWQKRYFVLNRSWLYYFKKYGDSNPKGVVRLLPTGWSKVIPQGTRRMVDAVVSTNEKNPGIMSVLRCMAVHRPNNFAASLSSLLGADEVAEAFRSQTVSVTSSQHSSRTFYMTASSNDERDLWVDAINTNIRTYSHSAEALTAATKEMRCMLRAVKSNAPPKDIPALLLLLHVRHKEITARHAESCEVNH